MKRFLFDRFLFFTLIFYGALFLISARLFYLQIPLGSFFSKKSNNNFTRFQTIFPLRGNITDTSGILLATNRPVINVIWQGTGNRTLTEHQEILLKRIENLSQKGFDAAFIKKIKQAERYKTKIVVIGDLSPTSLASLLEQFSMSENLVIENNFRRYYPYGHLASHLLGYINQIDQKVFGRMGLESLLQGDLQGKDGQRMLIINSVGTNIFQQETLTPLKGDVVCTTLDVRLQLLAEEFFPKEFLGTLLVMDPRTGALRVILSRPDFDPSMFLKTVKSDEWHNFQQGQPLLNRAFNACYPPASIFKLITMSAALEHKIIEQDDTIMCRGSLRLGSRPYHCANRHGHGMLSVKEALSKSCNILFFYIGKHLSIDVLADYAQRFGLGSKTDVLFPERAGLVPSIAWKRQTKGEPWWRGDTLSCAIGQSYLLTTPIQIARMIGAIFEGRLVRPRILEEEPISYQFLNIKQETLDFLQESMKLAADEGTGQLVGRIKDIKAYTKTGTAETTTNKSTPEHAWFVAYFQYKAEPLVLVILVENVGAAKVATRIAKNYLNGYKKLMDEKLLDFS